MYLEIHKNSPWENLKILRVAWLLYICCLYIPASSQDHQNKKWYFGNSAEGIIFSRSSNVATAVTDQSVPFGTGGSAVAIDPATSNLLFYTDGNTVYDAYHNQMPNGLALNANNTSNQPATVSIIPGEADKYYIFTNTANYPTGGNINTSVVNISISGNAIASAHPLGDVEVSNTAIGLTNRSEGMIIIPHDNGIDFWLITHEINSSNYAATLINTNTYNAGVVGTFNTTPSAGVGPNMAVAHLAYSSTLKKIAVSAQSPNDNSIVLDFDDTTGSITFDRSIENTGSPTNTTNQSIYDLEWSPSGQYIYLSKYGGVGVGEGNVLQYDYLNASDLLIPVLPNPVYRSYGLQIAPDKAIYHLYQANMGGAFLLGKLTDISLVADEVQYESFPFGVANFSATQFPAFLPKSNINIMVNFSFSGTCQNAPTTFFATVIPGADSLMWDFGDGQAGRGVSPNHTYTQAQTYNVSLTAFYGDQQQNVMQPVSINAFTMSIKMVRDTTACRSEFPPPRGSATPEQFKVIADIQEGNPISTIWSNGDIGPTLQPDSAGYYYVVVTDASGCSVYAGVNVKEYELEDSHANVWYFGDKAGIDFNPSQGPPIALDNSAMNAPEGTATMSDRNGQVLFYTNGDKVYDKNHVEIANGIGGDPTAAQAALIFPVPRDETLYYIFTTKAMGSNSNHELRYSLFDIKQNDGFGAIVEQNILLYSKSTERITANNSWIISHEYGNSTFRAYPITENGIGNPVFSSIGSPHSFESWQTGEGYMQLHPNDTIAVALSNPGVSNVIETFHFDNATGVLDDYSQIDLNEPNGQIYGISFSSGGSKIFATLKNPNGPSSVYEYYFNPNGGEAVLVNNTIAPTQELGALAIGPDGVIYIAINGSNMLGTIQPLSNKTQSSPVNFSGFTLAAGTNSGLGLPSFRQFTSNSIINPDISVFGTCLGDSTYFVGTPTDDIDEFQWDFGDGNGDTLPRPAHLYNTTGIYMASLQLTNRCGLNITLDREVTITPAASPPTIPSDIALCIDPIILDANSNNLPGYTYLWASGDTTKTITVNEAVIISVNNINTHGCIATAEIFVADNRPPLDLGPDITTCSSDIPYQLDALNPGAIYTWTINGINASTNQIQVVDISVSGSYAYEVTVLDPITNCIRVVPKTFTVMVSPSATMSGTSPTTCFVSDGTLTLQINISTPPSGPYSYTITGPAVSQQRTNQVAPMTIGPLTALEPGIFLATVTDQISGCSTDETFELSDPGGFRADFNYTDCDPTDIEVVITEGAPVLPVLYTYTNSTTGQVVGPTPNNTAQLNPGTGNYTVTAHDDNGNGCLMVINKEIIIAPKSVTIVDNICSIPATLVASLPGADSYTWTGPGIVSGENTNTITIDEGGNYEVIATISGCDVINSEQVEYTLIIPDFSQSDACTTSVTLTATPNGPYTYQWFKEGILQPNLLEQMITLGLSEDTSNYSVGIGNTVNKCVYQSPDKRVNVVGPIDASLEPIQACNDGKPFTLTAITTTTGVSYSWFLNNNIISNANESTTDQIQDGLYKVHISKSVCTASAEINIIKASIPQDGNLINKVPICDHSENNGLQTDEAILNPGEYEQYDWFKDEVSMNTYTQSINVRSPGIYKVVVTNSYNCTNSDQTEVVSQCTPVITAPNAFRPSSNQEINKKFSLFTFFITDKFSIFIHNRWGELIYQSNDRFFEWDGYHYDTERPVPIGSYTYIIKYVDLFKPELGAQEKRGGVMLIR